MGRWFAIKKFGRITLVSMLLVCALCTSGESWTPQDYDGQWQVYSPGWSYMWLSSGNYAVWKNDAIGWGRFVYAYTPGQWFDGSWNSIGNNGASSAFIGDGAWHNLNNGWSYDYLYANDYAAWSNTSIGRVRFISAYTQGQWFDGSWNKIGGTGTSMAFLGDGTWHDLNNGWSYDYISAYDYAAWKNNAIGRVRFISAYTQGQWFDGSWNKIGGTGTSMAFLGDGTWHNLNNGWSYDYISAYDYAAWKNNAIGRVRFISAYTQGQWFDGTWNPIGVAHTSSAFIGDGAYHTVSPDWAFLYASTPDTGTWRRVIDGANRFQYAYGTGQWFNQGAFDTGAWYAIGDSAVSSAFIGDGAWHGLTPYLAFSYDNPTDTGTWRRQADGSNRFRYGYGTGEWLSTSPYNGDVWNGVGPTPNSPYSSAFIGDGAWHELHNWVPTWSYSYNASTDSAQWKFQGDLQFRYNHGIGQWSHYDRMYSTWRELSATGITNLFIGHYDQRDIGNGWSYSFLDGVGRWLGVSTPTIFTYAYGYGQWSYGLDPGLRWLLGSPGLSAVFMGDGAQHDLSNGWLVAFSTDASLGSKANFYRNEVGTPLRFSLSWGGWSHYDGTNSAVMEGFGRGLGLGWLWDGSRGVAGGTLLFAYDYANDELAFYATVSGTPSFNDHPVAFLKYSYGDHRWYDRRADSTASWYSIPAVALQHGTTMAEVEKTWWVGSGYFIGDTKVMSINADYHMPMESVSDSTQLPYVWTYTYTDGTWSKWDNDTNTSTIVAGPGADPNLYR